VTNAAQRILTALIAVPLVLAITFLGGWFFGLLVCAAAAIAQHELYGIARARGARPFTGAGIAVGCLVVLSPLAPGLMLAAVAILVGIVLYLPFSSHHADPMVDVATTVFGIAYPSAMLAGAVALRQSMGPFVGPFEAFWLVVVTMVLVWATDTFAYFGGRRFGKHQLAPSVSPKKTWEGAISGVAGALVIAIMLKVFALPFLTWLDITIIALICGVVSQLGDLAESRLKRAAGVKDSGTILPGHGGVLDRLDALIVAAPLVYVYLLAAGRIIAPF
jgi:phosphatidate cytidylyltransferase